MDYKLVHDFYALECKGIEPNTYRSRSHLPEAPSLPLHARECATANPRSTVPSLRYSMGAILRISSVLNQIIPSEMNGVFLSLLYTEMPY